VALAGTGAFVILIHGFAYGWYSWRHQISVTTRLRILRGVALIELMRKRFAAFRHAPPDRGCRPLAAAN
jgi:hypothetical protein